MDKEIKEKYNGFVFSYISQGKVCMSTKMKQKYGEKFFDDATKDKILIEIENNDIGLRQFIFTKHAEEILQ